MKQGVIAGILVVLAATAARSGELTIAAGAGYRRPVSAMIAAYEKASGDKVGQIYGNMGQVIGQARESGKVSVICGDRKVLDKAEGLTFSRFAPLGAGRLVVAFRKGVALKAPDDIAAANIARIGVPDEKAAVYGKAGRQFLERAGLAKAVDSKLVAVATVPQVTAYLIRGEVDAGFLNATDAIGAGDELGGWLEVDHSLYDPIEIACGAIDDETASGFMSFLTTPAAAEIVRRSGL